MSVCVSVIKQFPRPRLRDSWAWKHNRVGSCSCIYNSVVVLPAKDQLYPELRFVL